MINKKNILKSLLLSFLIIFIFVMFFEFLGATNNSIGIVMTTIIVFTILFCTYEIIDEIKKLKNN